MITEQQTPAQTNGSLGLTPLITGIINDGQQLIRQQLTLFQTELKGDLSRTKDAAVPLGIGLFVSHIAGVLVFLMLVHLLDWLYGPRLPLFASYGIVGGILALVGGGLVLFGKAKFDAFSPLPDKSVEGLKENVQWQTKT